MKVIDKRMEKVESCVFEGDVTLVSKGFFLTSGERLKGEEGTKNIFVTRG